MTPNLDLPQPHPAQAHILNSTKRYRVVAAGRRFGKTTLGERAILDHLIQGHQCVWLAASYQLMIPAWTALMRAVGHDLSVRIEESAFCLTHSSGGLLRMAHPNWHPLKMGSALDFVVLDEAAFMPSYIWYALTFPTLIEKRGGALFLSTPRGKKNWFYDLYGRGLTSENDDWQSFQYPTRSNPFVPADELDDIALEVRETMFRQDFEAEFIDDETGAV